jgi:penicillin-binding protein 1A
MARTIKNKIYKKIGKNLEKFRLEKSINWKLAIVKKINKFSVEIETEKKIKGIIEYKDISWTKKEFNEFI